MLNRGAIAEAFVGQALLAYSNPARKTSFYYWHREAHSSNAELDYLLQQRQNIIPIEVKSGKFRKTHPKLKIIYSGDDLFSNQPFIDELKAANMSFILVAKPSSHIILYEWFTDIKRMGEACLLEFTQKLNIKLFSSQCALHRESLVKVNQRLTGFRINGTGLYNSTVRGEKLGEATSSPEQPRLLMFIVPDFLGSP